MTTTPPDAPAGPGPQDGPGQGPRTTRDEVRDLGRLRRSTTDRKIAGVAGGLARHLDVDPLVLRVVLVVLVFFGGAGVLLYGACWLLVPEDDGSEATVQLDDRTRSVALIVVGVLAALALVGDSWGFIGFPWPVVVIGAIVVYLISRNRQEPAGSPAVTPTVAREGATPVPPTHPYAVTAHHPPYVPPAPYVPPVPRNPRRRGPLLFWFTLALIALAEGVLGIVDLAGAPVTDSAYPALALAITGAMLVVGAFYGRAGGLILVGAVAAVVLAATSAADRWTEETITARPELAADLDPSYRFGAGELVIDLTDIEDLEALDGRVLELDVSVGRIEVIVPEGLAVDARAVAHGPGSIDLFGDKREGVDTSATERRNDGLDDQPELTIDAEVNVGEIQVRTR
ncbi:PspC domain-containing protein [Nocardioides dongkuii]|uniref:PspC domain-containing protein n=1 Tax=Nocardioides dongkuii TaxID=2760089 RepID=UPI0015FA7B21|nr:PspC domain-containing protein [Nocardioides dongkuii]